jgi:hypothetical protein
VKANAKIVLYGLNLTEVHLKQSSPLEKCCADRALRASSRPASPSDSDAERAFDAIHPVPIQVVGPAQRDIKTDVFSNLSHEPASVFQSGSPMLTGDAIGTTKKNCVLSPRSYTRD